MPIQDFIDTTALLLLIVSNSTPVVLTHLMGDRLATPIDGGRLLKDGRPLFGSHKTWRGLISGTLAAGMTGALLQAGFWFAAIFGAAALAGDLVSSFLKRRMAFRSGRSALLLDQLPEALLPMLLLRTPLNLSATEIIGTCVAFAALDVLTSRLRP